MKFRNRFSAAVGAALLTAACQQPADLPEAPSADIPFAPKPAAVTAKAADGTWQEYTPETLDCASSPGNLWCAFTDGTRARLAFPASVDVARHVIEGWLNGSVIIDYAWPEPELYGPGLCAAQIVGPRKPPDPKAEKEWPHAIEFQAHFEEQVLPVDQVRSDPDFFERPDDYYLEREYLAARPGSAADGRRAVVGCAPDKASAQGMRIGLGNVMSSVAHSRAWDYILADNTLLAKEKREQLRLAVIIPVTHRER